MRWYLNDLSLQGQFATPQAFVQALTGLLKLRMHSQLIFQTLFCSRMFALRPATAGRDCRGAVTAHTSQEEKRLILSWVTTRGPFIDDERLFEEDDYFEFDGTDVTDQGLGEAARRLKASQAAGVFSFTGGPRGFERTPLQVQHGLSESPIGFIDVLNVWNTDDLQARALAGLAEPESWEQLIGQCRLRFDRLMIADDVLIQLNSNPFFPGVAKRVIELLRVLQEYMEDRQLSGEAGQHAMELYQQYFVGDRARFSDESSENKRVYKAEMTFRDPQDASKAIFCPWHGKIQTPQFRIHFEWPAPIGQAQLKIFYIGPKITKR